MDNPDITFRNGIQNDMPIIEDLIQSVGGDDRQLNPSQFIVACDNNRIVGCIRTVQAESDCKELASLIVLPEYRNKGIGTTLVNKILNKDISRPLYLICYKKMANFYTLHNFKVAEISKLPATLARDFKQMTEKKGSEIVTMVLY